MKFGGLSENEIAKISEILNAEGISFSVEKDKDIEEFNTASMNNNLRHYTPPNISTHILAILIADEDFSKISHLGKERLLDFGITDQIPDAKNFQPYTGNTIHKELVEGSQKVVVSNFKHQFLLGIFLLILVYVLKHFLK